MAVCIFWCLPVQLGDGKTNDNELSGSQHVENEELTKMCVCAPSFANAIEDRHPVVFYSK